MNFIQDKIDGFVWGIAAKRAVSVVVKVAIAFLASKVVSAELTRYGVSIDPATLTNSLTLTLTAVLDVAHHWIQSKGIKI